jgi:hypothetical protein
MKIQIEGSLVAYCIEFSLFTREKDPLCIEISKIVVRR